MKLPEETKEILKFLVIAHVIMFAVVLIATWAGCGK